MRRNYITDSGFATEFIKTTNKTIGYFFTKRIFDISLSVLLILSLLPLLLFVSLMIKMFSNGPIFFKQTRVGFKGETFEFYKFRSMHVNMDDKIHREFTKNWIANNEKATIKDGDIEVHKIVRDPRVIPFVGSFIRKFSIDELPQLLNVIKGEMSLIGPRPSLPYEVENYKDWHKGRFDTLPGISGLWQISGRNRLTFDEMVKLDLKYIESASFKMDLIIALKTPLVVLFDKAY